MVEFMIGYFIGSLLTFAVAHLYKIYVNEEKKDELTILRYGDRN